MSLMVPVIDIDEELAAFTRERLTFVGVRIAQDIINLGCTGIVGRGVSVDDTKRVRMGLAGSGVGLPCYVGSDLFCLVHEVIGGLQDGQAQRHANFVRMLSRALAPAEIVHRELIDGARRQRGDSRDASDMLSGRKLPTDFLAEVGAVIERELPAPAAPAAPVLAAPLAGPASTTPVVPLGPPNAEAAFKCPDHLQPCWDCRYCVASEIVKGDLVPSFALHCGYGGVAAVEATAIDTVIAAHDAEGANLAELYVRVARWKRKLARD
jgi:hypothetical protein